jgi:hypothetical protein
LGNQETDTAVTRLRLLFEFEGDAASEIEFCSLHFNEMQRDEFDVLPLEIVQAIVSHRSLKLRDEDSLYRLIESAVRRDARFAVLFESVRFEYLSRESMESFITLISNCFDFLTAAVWSAIAKRLILPVSGADRSDRVLCDWVECRYPGSVSLDGIIAHLSRKPGGSVIDTGAVSVTASGIDNPYQAPL